MKKQQEDQQHDEPLTDSEQGGDTEIKDPILELEDQVAEWREKYLLARRLPELPAPRAHQREAGEG